MCEVQVSKNLYRGRRVRSINELKRLSKKKKGVAILKAEGGYLIRPASFLVNWSDITLDALFSRGVYRTRKTLKEIIRNIFKRK